ncbi:hypothetical protein ACJJTC_005535 [Scirpophaga incertulas]
MKVLVLAALVAAAAAVAIRDEFQETVFKKDSMVNVDVKTKEMYILKLLNHILQPTMYEDIREIAREYSLEDNVDKYLKVEVVKNFVEMYKVGMLPRGEVFVHTSERQMEQAVTTFRVLYFAKDFDVFVRTACFMRERINPGMFVYAVTAAVFHRVDCRGITLPAPYEIYPYFFVDSQVIDKVFKMKMTKAAMDPVIRDYYGIKVKDNNIVVVDWRKGTRNILSPNDQVSYFTEDIDINTYMYYLHMNYPYWMTDEVYSVNKERRGEVYMYAQMQLLARYELERLSKNMCSVKPVVWHEMLNDGYWPKIRMHNGESMPARRNHVTPINQYNIEDKILADDIESIIREAIIKGHIEMRDGTRVTLQKAEDIEYLARMVLGGYGFKHDDAKVIHVSNVFKRVFSINNNDINKYTYVPGAIDMYSTCLRDPVFWRLMKRITNVFVLYKNLLPHYTRDEVDFPGVKVTHVTTDKLVTYMDEYDVDVTNAVYLDSVEMQKKRSDMIYVARMHRLNHQPFKVNIEVDSDKAVDAIVRVFIGPKYDCNGEYMTVNDKRLGMVEIDSFLYKLNTGRNTIVRDSVDMHGVIQQRPWTRRIWDRSTVSTGYGVKSVDSWWHKSRTGFPHRLLLPMGTKGGFKLQMYVIVSPVRTGRTVPSVDMSISQERHNCRFTTCVDTMPLGFPFDRPVVEREFYTNNMKFVDVSVYRKDMATSNQVRETDTSNYVMKREDLTYLDNDLMVPRSYRDVMVMDAENTAQV